MGYSKITSVELYNFMSFKKAKVVFDESNIINLKGFNDSGKSAILRAIAVCTTNAYKRKQAKFIHYGEDYFRIVISFDDGVSIIRDKYINGQSLYEMYKNGQLVFTTKQGNRLSKVEDVPQIIQDYLGFCTTDLRVFNYQNNKEKLPLIEDTGSENYENLHVVLRMEEIFRANQLINIDKNELGREITSLESELNRNEILLSRCKGVSKELISTLECLEDAACKKDFQKSELEELDQMNEKYNSVVVLPTLEKINTKKFEDITSLKETQQSLLNIPNLPEMSKVEVDRCKSLEELLNMQEELNNFSELPVVPRINMNLVSQQESLLNLRNLLNEYDSMPISCPAIPKVSSELCNKMESLKASRSILKEYGAAQNEVSSIEANLTNERTELDSIVEQAKEEGMKFVKCSNCGTYNAINVKEA